MSFSILTWFGLTFASALGGVARYWVSGLVAARHGERFPLGTLIVNLSGALAAGVAAHAVIRHGLSQDAPLLLWAVAGFLGSYTTVSSFSHQTLMLIESGEFRRALINVVASVAGCLAAVATGYLLGAWLWAWWA